MEGPSCLADAVDGAAQEDGGHLLTYAELSAKSTDAARGLAALGVRRPHPLLTGMRRGCDWYVVYVASSRLGVPVAAMATEKYLDPDARARRRNQFLSLQPQLAVAAWQSSASKAGLALHRLSELLCTGTSAASLPELPSDVGKSDALCYCYTGGTTGRERCVEIHHGMALHELRSYPAALRLRPATRDSSPEDAPRVLQPSSLQWAAAVYGQLDVALAFRGCAVVTAAKQRASAGDAEIKQEELVSIVKERKVSVLGLPPSLLQLLAPSDFLDARSAGGYCRLRRLISWGEPCPSAVAERWGAGHLPWRFLDVLISTEYWLTFVSYERDENGRSLFEPVPGVKTFLLPPALEDTGAMESKDDLSPSEVGEGAVGELYLAGDGVCRSFVHGGSTGPKAFAFRQLSGLSV
ncbi:Linear gramicidin synthase subunit D [Symbiodinium microadriaticum]|uniref:Linear gramicidin synthase subunit D n=1 Tax=Symbiodinium microadriaticum TaxID=2951 RepID=A0A1Q9DYF7_SYMMI|nr:Linear gramicidin synthase subunit D [Symbiodinium microadriaticum]